MQSSIEESKCSASALSGPPAGVHTMEELLHPTVKDRKHQRRVVLQWDPETRRDETACVCCDTLL